ncbi:hypothetical protein CROQUDRAFT_651575 [Cronartium quercuum f. sp. fusiforme G11]|uniref:HMG box domain-containing protein n=1 Tax=Cronartium quercuum f. sp. fusiforme G11 TaxID=708437 RepID=A0A9P6THR8_9BASI|nr:hypothetical protein CROQUDRAFT_651575 [Cronartium quercuum f. sp. fusiforme G11]
MVMDMIDHPTVSLDDFLVSINSEQTTPEPNDPFDFSNQSQPDTTRRFEPDLAEHQIQHTPTSTDCFFSPPAHLEPSFEIMSAPALALAPPTPFDDCFQTPNISAAARALSRLHTNFDHTHTSAYPNLSYDPQQLLDPSSGFISSPLSSHASLYGSPTNPDRTSFVSPLTYCPPIARRQHGHQRDLSAASSLASSASSLAFESSQLIDPTTLGPPLALSSPNPPIISPFINQTVDQGPDGSATGKYQRPLTSTGRPSHARKTPPGHVKRPRNAFILFRSHACAANLIPPTVEKDHRQISRIVSHMWRNLPPTERGHWEREAEQEKELHRLLHPDYRYKPVYRKEGTAKKKPGSGGRRKPMNRKTPVSETTPATPEDDDNRSPMQREQEAEDALRCEVVARVVMETKLSGIQIEESQMEARVTEEIRNLRRKDAQAQAEKKSERPIPPPLLQSRRKSRANSAPPPPSPLRTMHVHEVVYNPKSRGSRELSPDFPRARVAHPMAIQAINDNPGSYWPMPGFGAQDDYQPMFDYSCLASYELGSGSSFFGTENQLDFGGFDHTLTPLSPRQPSDMVRDLSEFPFQSSSSGWAPADERADFTLALPEETHTLEQFENPFETLGPGESEPVMFLTRDQSRKDSLVKQLFSAGYEEMHEA